MVRHYDGTLSRLDDALGFGWSVIGIGVDPRTSLGSGGSSWESVGATFATVHPTGGRPQGEIGDGLGHAVEF